jgi:hypothetical protein
MAGPSLSMTIEEIQNYAARLRKLADACDIATKQMRESSTQLIYVSGKPTSEQCYDRIHSFVNNVIGEAFNPSPRSNTVDEHGSEKLTDRETWAKEIHERVINTADDIDSPLPSKLPSKSKTASAKRVERSAKDKGNLDQANAAINAELAKPPKKRPKPKG